MRACAAALVAAAAALLASAPASAARYAVGLAAGADAVAVRAALERRTGAAVESLAPLPALVAVASSPRSLAGIAGVSYVERLGERRLAFVPNDPLLPRQWYLAQNRSYDAWGAELPPLAPVRVALIDSGIDGTHPELAAHVAAARSFVGGSPLKDTQGHGTFVAGIVAATVNDAVGIAGLAPSAELLVAKVVTPQRTIPVEAEAKAIRWAVDSGARVINMSLGGLRDPTDTVRDTYSRLEAAAIAYAVRKGAVVVAAVGNGDQAPTQPWRYASWPAALPHVLGVSALARSGAAPPFSNRDALYNDIAAPGQDILSTFPLPLTAERPACPEQGYSSCGSEEYRRAEGTSFATPQVAATAAMMLAIQPSLTPDQVTTVLERSAVDAVYANGCRVCPLGRDPFTGWGRLDAAAALTALAGPLPARDSFEPNDDAGSQAYRLWGRKRTIHATLDFWDDQNDVYGVYLRRGQRLFVAVTAARGMAVALALWRPGTTSVDTLAQQGRRLRLSTRLGRSQYVGYRATASGWYDVHVKLSAEGAGPYRLSFTKTPA